MSPSLPHAPRDVRDGFSWWSLGLVLLVSAGYESLFIHRGINHLDESWPLYAAMRLHAGGTLYHDVLWVFPPGHVWIGWIAYALEPPGFVAARIGYAAFTVALVGVQYLLARRLMPEPFALLAGLLLAVAAPRGHAYHVLFGYRYLVFSMLALLAFDQRLRGGSPRWMMGAGALTGLAFVFRQDPPFAASCGVAAGLLATQRDPRRWLQDGALFAAGAALVVLPVITWFAASVGLPRLWREVVIHPFAMLQPLSPPDVVFPTSWDRVAIYSWFTALQFRAIWCLYVGYAAVLSWLWWRARRRSEPFRHGLLVAFVTFGAAFFIRSTGRSDEPHLDSAIPPVCLLVAHLLSVAFARVHAGELRRDLAGAWVAWALASWIFLLGTDWELRAARHDRHPLRSLGGRTATSEARAADIDGVTHTLQTRTMPGETILSLAHAPMFYLLSGRLGPGHFDVMMPGTFVDEEDETSFLELLNASPPAAVVWPREPFDSVRERGILKTAPRLMRWTKRHYEPLPAQGEWLVGLRRSTNSPPDPGPPESRRE